MRIKHFKLVLLTILLSSFSFADLTNNDAYIYDSSGNALNSTSNALNEFLINSSIAVTQSGSWTNACTQSGTWTVQQGTPPWSVSQSGTWNVTANAGTNLNTSLLALQSGMNSFLDTHATGTLGALNAFVSLNTNGMSTAIATVSGTWVGTISLQCSNGTLIGAPGLTLPAGGITTALSSNGSVAVPVGGCSSFQVQMTAYTSGSASVTLNAGNGLMVTQVFNDSGSPLVVKGNGTAGSPDTNVVTVQGITSGTPIKASIDQTTPGTTNLVAATPVDGYKATYTACSGTFAIAAVATDVFYIQGSATKTVRIIHSEINGSTTSGSGALAVVSIIKRSAANTGGTSTAITIASHDSTNAAATASAVFYTANPSALGATAGTVRSDRENFTAVGTPGTNLAYDFGTTPGQAIVLRGTTQYLVVNFNATSVTGGNMDICFDFTEE